MKNSKGNGTYLEANMHLLSFSVFLLNYSPAAVGVFGVRAEALRS
jgi:hypothetical protein